MPLARREFYFTLNTKIIEQRALFVLSNYFPVFEAPLFANIIASVLTAQYRDLCIVVAEMVCHCRETVASRREHNTTKNHRMNTCLL